MKTLPSAYATHIALGTTSLADSLKITRTDDQVFAFTSAVLDAVISGVTYRASPGLNITSIVTSSGLAVDNLELTTLDDGSTFQKVDVLGGVWRNAKFVVGRYNWANPGGGMEVLMVGTIGEVHLGRGMITAELRGLQQYLQQPVGSVTSKTCRARLGDSKCTVDLGPFTVTGTITSAADKQTFTDSARTESDDWFGEGVLTFTSGLNTGLSQKVKAYAAGVFTLSLPMIQSIGAGDTYSVYAGCRKRHDRTLANISGVSDCLDKFDNVLNFQGEPHLPGIDALSKSVV